MSDTGDTFVGSKADSRRLGVLSRKLYEIPRGPRSEICG